MQSKARKRLTCTRSSRTLYDILKVVCRMDETTKKLVRRNSDLHREIAKLQREADSIKLVLESIGLRSKDFDSPWDRSPKEAQYAEKQTFAAMTLVDTCKRILLDFPHALFTKNEIEYLAAMGGYPFSTKNAANSVDVTMRRIAKDGLCEVHHRKGPDGNIYCLTPSRFVDIAGDKFGFSDAMKKKLKAKIEEFEEGSKDAASTKASAKQ
jgi:hypothetical protein